MEFETRSNHFVGMRMELGRGSIAHWSKSPASNLIVFVHGFNGTAEGTWLDIASELRSDSSFKYSDFVFVGYESLRSRALVSARIVADIIRRLVRDPASIANQNLYYLAKRKQYKYKTVTVICHSLGAALIRRVAVDFAKSNDPALTKVRLVLFAPAHKGATLHTLFESVSRQGAGTGLLAWARNLVTWRKQVFFDLSPASDFIKKIEADTEEAIANFGALRVLVAQAVYFGEHENVVEVSDFAKDPPFVALPNRNHTDLVKTKASLPHVLDACRETVM